MDYLQISFDKLKSLEVAKLRTKDVGCSMKHVGLSMKNEEGGVASEYEQTDRLSMNQKDWSNMALAPKIVKIKKLCILFPLFGTKFPYCFKYFRCL